MKTLFAPAALAALVTLTACGRLQDTDQIAQSTGDVMASLDESTVNGQIAVHVPYQQGGALSRPSVLGAVKDFVISPAWASTCSLANTFSTCSAGVRSKDFGSCSYNALTFSGLVTLTFSDASCDMAAVGAAVTRTADFKIANGDGYELKVTSTGGGQKLTRTGVGAFNYTVLGMNRVLTDKSGTKKFDISTRTLEDIGVTGTSRSDRVANGGKLEVKHNLAGYTTELVPQNLTWNSSCNCPVSGKLVGNVTGGTGRRSVNEDFVVEVTACGKATVTTDNETKDLTFDRCYAN